MGKKFFDFYFFKNLRNTNDKIKEIQKINNNSYLALYCENQKYGRGRKGRIWESKKGDLTCSFLIRKKINIKQLGRINLIVVSILIDIFKNLGFTQVKFKWPNDILINTKKISGILLETNVSDSSISQFTIGIGINMHSKLKNKNYSAISLNELGIKIDPLHIFFLIISNLYYFLDNFSNIQFNLLSKKLSGYFFDKSSLISVLAGKQINQGFFKKINSLGELFLEKDNELLKISYGEII